MSKGKHRIVAVRTNEEGDLTNFKLDNGRELEYHEAVQLVQSGQIEHVDLFHRFGRDIIRSEPDGSKANNLDNMPRF